VLIIYIGMTLCGDRVLLRKIMDVNEHEILPTFNAYSTRPPEFTPAFNAYSTRPSEFTPH
jgi:hypothetical protein